MMKGEKAQETSAVDGGLNSQAGVSHYVEDGEGGCVKMLLRVKLLLSPFALHHRGSGRQRGEQVHTLSRPGI